MCQEGRIWHKIYVLKSISYNPGVAKAFVFTGGKNVY